MVYVLELETERIAIPVQSAAVAECCYKLLYMKVGVPTEMKFREFESKQTNFYGVFSIRELFYIYGLRMEDIVESASNSWLRVLSQSINPQVEKFYWNRKLIISCTAVHV